MFTFAMIISSILACTSTKKTTASAIAVVPLHNYVLNEDSSYSNDINFLFIGSANMFYKTFSMTKTTIGKAIVPEFGVQSVVAIIMKPTEKVVTVEINKAIISGKDLNIYYSITDTTSWQTYQQRPIAVVAVPKNPHVAQVNFYKDNIKEKTMIASY